MAKSRLLPLVMMWAFVGCGEVLSNPDADVTPDALVCGGGTILCDGECVDPNINPDYCGASADCAGANAGEVCEAGVRECVAGACACAGELLECDGACIDPAGDQVHCGASGDCVGENAGERCSFSAVCNAGACEDTCVNCGFETGDFTGWEVVDLTQPYYPLSVETAGGGSGFFQVEPTEGIYAVSNGFDGNGPGTIELSQEVTIADLPGGTLLFDYRAGWNNGGILPRTFSVVIEDNNGGMQSELILSAAAGENVQDTGPQIGMIDLSAYAGQTILIRFVWEVPETFTGPAQFQFDNVRIVPPGP